MTPTSSTKVEELVEFFGRVAPPHKEGTARGFAFNMDGLCLQELNAKINEAAQLLQKMMEERRAIIEQCAGIAEGHATCGCNGHHGVCMIDDAPKAIAEEIRALSEPPEKEG